MDELLAKPDKTLTKHTIEVYRLGKEIAQKLGLQEEDYKRALLACLFHDIGKSTKSFQKYVRGEKKKSYPHALASFPFILIAEYQLLKKPLLATAAVLSHHSPLSPWLYEGWGPPDILKKEIQNFLKEIPDLVPDCRLEYGNIFANAIRLDHPSDILHSSAKKVLSEFQRLPRERYASIKTVLHLADWLSSANKSNINLLFLQDGEKILVDYIKNKKYQLREFQEESYKNGFQDINLRAPTGSGKTEALLLWASRAPRILYLLPTQATVNAMWRRLSAIFGEENVGLAHGKAKYTLRKKWEQENQEEDEPPLDLHLFGAVFAKPVNVATLDQYLMGFLNGRHWEERQTLSKHSYVIIDEIHAYEPYTLGILKYVLEKHRPAKLGMASATFPDSLLEFFGGNNLVKADQYFWKRKRHRLHCIDYPIEEGLKTAVELAKTGKKVLIIVNTVQKSQELYRKITDTFNWKRTILLHSRFTFRDRIFKEEKALKAEKGSILISTQIVEVSLDISFDVLLTEITPVDALIQRMGRVNRRGEEPPADVFIFTISDEASQRVYGNDLLELSKEIVCSLPECPTEEKLVRATNELYVTIVKTENFRKDFIKGYNSALELQKILGNYTIDLGDDEMRNRFITRKGVFSLEVIPQKFIDESYKLVEKRKKWKLVDLTVPIPGYWAKIWQDDFSVDEGVGYPFVYWDYNEEIGLLKPDKYKSFQEF